MNDDHSSRKKSAVITGSTSGIGLGLAQAFARSGYNIMLNGLGELAEINQTKSELENKYNVDVGYSAADMSKPSEVTSLIAEAAGRFDGIEILINNAGIQFVSEIENFPDASWDKIIAINLSSNFHATKAVVPIMKKQGFGRIINIASVHGLVASPFKSAYVAAKHGVLGLTKTVALELANTGVTCNAICPGYVLTPLIESQIEQQALVHHLPKEKVISDVILASQPQKSFVEVEQLAELALFLASSAAKNLTGAALPMDGGWTAR